MMLARTENSMDLNQSDEETAVSSVSWRGSSQRQSAQLETRSLQHSVSGFIKSTSNLTVSLSAITKCYWSTED